MSISVMIVDDEVVARRRIRRLLDEEPGVTLVGECRTGEEAIAAIKERRPDLVFLDVQMPGLDGFGVLRALDPEAVPAVIFVTAFDEYALRAFEVHALDYLLKPFDAERFREAFGRVRRLLGERPVSSGDARILALLEQLAAVHGVAPGRSAARHLDRVAVKSDGRIVYVKTGDVDWIESTGNYARLHVGRATHLIRATLTALEQRLDPTRFARIHRSTIINLDRIRELQPWFGGEYVVILHDGTRLRLSRWYRDELHARLEGGAPGG